MYPEKCGSCGDQLTDGVLCTACKQTLHFHCASITEAGYRRLGERKLTWRCLKCKQTSNSPKTPNPNTESSVLQEIRALSAKLTPLEGLKDEIMGLRDEFAELSSSFNKKFDVLFNEFNDKIEAMEQRIVQVEKIQCQVNHLQAYIEKSDEESDSKDQWNRMNNIEIKGVPHMANENLFDIVVQIGAKISYPIVKNQINFVTRVPTREKEHLKPIIVGFCNRYVKEDFIAASRYAIKNIPLTPNQIGLSGNHRIYINDHLTTKNKLLLSKTKKAATELNFRYVWVKYAKIHVRKTDTTPIIYVKSERDLKKLL